MADILLFGATGYTGRMTAAALAERGASFAIAGRNRAGLEELAARTGEPEIHEAAVGDVEALEKALVGCRVLVTCVGPFLELGATAVEAAVRSGVHYIDSTGEGDFIDRLASQWEGPAHAAGIALAPSLGLDEVPGDVACTLASEGMARPEIVVTYAFPRTGSAGSIRSALRVIGSTGPWIEDGRTTYERAGAKQRWSPLPPPLGPRRARSFPLALGRLTPRHIDVRTFKTFVTAGNIEGHLLRSGAPILGALNRGPAKALLDRAIGLLPEGPSDEERREGHWTILVEAREDDRWRNVVVTGTDAYGLTARTLSRAAVEMSAEGYEGEGLLSPVEAVGLDPLRSEMDTFGVSFEKHEATS